MYSVQYCLERRRIPTVKAIFSVDTPTLSAKKWKLSHAITPTRQFIHMDRLTPVSTHISCHLTASLTDYARNAYSIYASWSNIIIWSISNLRKVVYNKKWEAEERLLLLGINLGPWRSTFVYLLILSSYFLPFPSSTYRQIFKRFLCQ